MEGFGTPFGSKLQLFNSNGYFLQVTPCKEICGTDDETCSQTHLQVCSAAEIGHVRLQGIDTNLFVCFNCNGQLYGEDDPDNPGTIFVEELQGSYNAYRSVCFPEWYLAIKKNGTAKLGHKTGVGQKATKFLPRRI